VRSFGSQLRMDASLPQCDGHVYVCRGASDTSLTLDYTASNEDDVYTGMKLRIVSGTGVGEERIILSYLGGAHRAVVAEWVSIPSVHSSQYVLESSGTKHGVAYGSLSRLSVGWLVKRPFQSQLQEQQVAASQKAATNSKIKTSDGQVHTFLVESPSLGHTPCTRAPLQDAIDTATGRSVHGREVRAADLFSLSLPQGTVGDSNSEYQQRVDAYACQVDRRQLVKTDRFANLMGVRHQVDQLSGAVISMAPALRINVSRIRARAALNPATLARVHDLDYAHSLGHLDSTPRAPSEAGSVTESMLSTELLGGTPASGKSDHDENFEAALMTLKRAQVEADLLASLAQVLRVRVRSHKGQLACLPGTGAQKITRSLGYLHAFFEEWTRIERVPT
jgi:hypothetical protein